MKLAKSWALLGALALLLAPAAGQADWVTPVGTLEADKGTYHWGDEVQLVHLVTNYDDTSYTYQFNQNPGWNVYAYENSAGLDPWSLLMTQEPLWTAFDRWVMYGYSITLTPGQTVECHYSWDLRDYDDEFVAPGIYEVVEDLTGQSARFTVTPEPGTVLLLVAAGVPLLMKHRR